jgi:hypothetical protein
MNIRYIIFTLAILGQIVLPQCVFAYIGPGAGISAIGTVVAFIGAILLAIVGFVWYPMKRMLAKLRKKEKGEQESEQETKLS